LSVRGPVPISTEKPRFCSMANFRLITTSTRS
jgi:hypothetical protein